MSETRVLVVDDHAIVRKGICALLRAEDDMQVVGEARTGDEAIREAERLKPDVVLMDLAMPRMGGLEATSAIQTCEAACPVVVLTIYDNAALRLAAATAGAHGFVTKQESCDVLLRAIRDVVGKQHGGE